MWSLSKAHAGGLCTARRELSPWPSTATGATWGPRFGANADCRLDFDCPRLIADTCIGFRQNFRVWFFYSASHAFVVRFPFIDNLRINALVCFRPHRMSNLPLRSHRPFLLHLSLPSLFLLVVCLFLSRILPLYTLCGDRWLRILELSFLASCRAGGTASSKIFSFPEIFFRSGYGPDCF